MYEEGHGTYGNADISDVNYTTLCKTGCTSGMGECDSLEDRLYDGRGN